MRKRRIEGLKDIYNEKINYLKKKETVQHWMEGLLVNGTRMPLFDKVEHNVYGETIVIYKVAVEVSVNNFLSSFKTWYTQQFENLDKNMISKIVNPVTSQESQVRMSYAAALIKEYGNEDQGHGNVTYNTPTNQKNRMYYGNAQEPIQKSVLNHRTVISTPTDAPTKQKRNAAKNNEDGVMKKLEEISKRQIEFEKSLKTEILGEVEKKFDERNNVTMSNENYENLDKRFEDLEKRFEKKIDSMVEEQQNQIDYVFRKFDEKLDKAIVKQSEAQTPLINQIRSMLATFSNGPEVAATPLPKVSQGVVRGETSI